MTDAEKSAAEQVRLVNEIWDVSELLDPGFSPEALRDLVRSGEELLPAHDLRRILHGLKKRHRKPETVGVTS
jgi:hypothetical protein